MKSKLMSFVSVKERLPNDGQVVLVYRPRINHDQGFAIWRWWSGDEADVTHWCELYRPQ